MGPGSRTPSGPAVISAAPTGRKDDRIPTDRQKSPTSLLQHRGRPKMTAPNRGPPILTTISSRCQRPVGRDQGAELDHPATDRLSADLDAALREQLLHVPDAEREPEIEPDRVPDDVRREAVTLKGDRLDQTHLQIGPTPQTGDKLALDCQH